MLVGLFLLGLVAAAQAQQTEAQVLRETVKQLQDQLKTVMDRLEQLELKQAAPAPVVPVPVAAAPAASWTDKLCITGYWQSRYEAREDTRDEFIMRRMYLSFVGNWNPKTQSILTFSRIPSGTDPNIEFEAAQVNYRFADDYSVTFGQVYNNFGYDTWESSSKRLPFDRWAAGEGVAGRPGRPGIRGLYFAGAADRGMYLARHARKASEPTIIAGVVNGNYNRGDNDDNKLLSLDLRFKRPSGMQYGVSSVYGKYTTDPPGAPSGTQSRKAVDLYFHTDPKPWGFQAEYIKGQIFGADMNGWYGQVARNIGKGTPYVRYEQYNQNEDTEGDTYMSLRAGYAYQLDKYNEFTLELQDAHAGAVDYGQLGFQWQLGF